MGGREGQGLGEGCRDVGITAAVVERSPKPVWLAMRLHAWPRRGAGIYILVWPNVLWCGQMCLYSNISRVCYGQQLYATYAWD